MHTFTEYIVEDAALAWLSGQGWTVAYGPDIAPDMQGAEHLNLFTKGANVSIAKSEVV